MLYEFVEDKYIVVTKIQKGIQRTTYYVIMDRSEKVLDYLRKLLSLTVERALEPFWRKRKELILAHARPMIVGICFRDNFKAMNISSLEVTVLWSIVA